MKFLDTALFSGCGTSTAQERYLVDEAATRCHIQLTFEGSTKEHAGSSAADTPDMTTKGTRDNQDILASELAALISASAYLSISNMRYNDSSDDT